MKSVSRDKIRNKLLTLLPKISNGVKKHRAEIILAVGVILISLLSFAMGFIVAKSYGKEPIKVQESGYYRGWHYGAVFGLETFRKGA